MSGIDIVGDIHGHVDQLLRLLSKLGYQRRNSGSPFAHPDGRTVAFVGDLINRGPASSEVICIVRGMTDAGSAFVVLGNHEFNLIAASFVGDEKFHKKYLEHLDWFRSLPFSLEIGGIRVVHAVWHPTSLKVIAGRTCSDEDFLRRAITERTSEHQAVQTLLKGIKVPIPRDQVYLDRFGIRRSRGRIRWWLDPGGLSYADLLFPSCAGALAESRPSVADLADSEPYPSDEPAVFIGHYCLPVGEPKIHGNVACVDGCVTCDGVLWAYRYTGERILDPDNLAQSD
ncbi:MAG: hypothetical protein HOH25_06170 [Opitutae bacterium]|jgi:hypothetical protein|nr:hypothetical protein [Opitutae bacterium]